ncbi:MAG: HAD hydrolase-like protein [Chloroflexi bacterium]|nr:HAD hydrolase-like protein [Chloroflexota bacterium]
MVGDRLETDIRMGQQAGMVTAVVLTGVATRAEAEQMPIPPDYVIENLGELPGLID